MGIYMSKTHILTSLQRKEEYLSPHFWLSPMLMDMKRLNILTVNKRTQINQSFSHYIVVRCIFIPMVELQA